MSINSYQLQAKVDWLVSPTSQCQLMLLLPANTDINKCIWHSGYLQHIQSENILICIICLIFSYIYKLDVNELEKLSSIKDRGQTDLS